MLVPSKLTEVRVHHQGATVRRELVVEGSEGRLPEELELPGLPLSLVDPSVRLRVTQLPDGADLVVASVHVGLHVPAKEDLPLEPDEEAVKKLRRSIEEQRRRLIGVSHEIFQLSTIQVPDRPEGEEGRPPPASPMGARLALEELVDDATKKRRAEARVIADELRALEEELAVLERKNDAARRARTANPWDITKSIRARLAQGPAPIASVTLALEYFVPGARWAPAYQCRLSRDGTEANLQLRALVAQCSGEAWTGAKISLSTAAPMSWTELPELESLRIGREQPPPADKRGFRPPPRGARSLFVDYDRARQSQAALLEPSSSFVMPDLSFLERTASIGSPVMSAPADAYGAGAAPAELDAPPPMMLKSADYADEEAPSRSVMMKESARMAPPAPKAAAASKKRAARREESSIAAPEEALEAVVFTSLRLPPPSSEQERSKLVAVDRRAAYQESLARSLLRIEHDPMSLVDDAGRRARAPLEEPLPPMTVDVRSAAAQFDYVYTADAPVDVPSDGKYHSIALGSRRCPSRMRYVVAPREDVNVFRIAELENPNDAPLISGPAELYVGGQYVLTTQVPTVGPRGRFEVGLGVEQAIKCARNTRYREDRSGSKIVATNELVHELEIMLVNNLGRSIDVEVRERIPQPDENAEVVVEEGAVSPPWQTYDQRERGRVLVGGRRWTVQVAPHAELTLKAQYVVKIYANNAISGGNRREA